jgi:putative zinc finger/helix-turn-helix YgiT family protein
LEERTFGEESFSAEIPCWRCSNCGEEIFDAEDRQRWGDALAAVLAQGRPTGQKFRFLRKHMELPAKELAALLAVTPETVSRWEGGKHEIPLAVWALLGVLVREHRRGEKTTLEDLQRMAQPSPRQVHFAL